MEINKKILQRANKILSERKIEKEKLKKLREYAHCCIRADFCPECGGQVERVNFPEKDFRCLACGKVTEL